MYQFIPPQCFNCPIFDPDLCRTCPVMKKYGKSKLNVKKSGLAWVTNGIVKDEHKPEKHAKRAYRFYTLGI